MTIAYDDPTINYDDANVLYELGFWDDPNTTYDDANSLYDQGNYIFVPPTDDIVPPIYVVDDPAYPTPPFMQKLMRHYKNQTRGRNIFKMSDGTFIDSQLQGQPPNMIQPPTDPYARSIYESGGALVEQDFFQVPYVVRTYYGGAANAVTDEEATELEAAGYGAYIFT